MLKSIALVVPCYNEANRLDIKEFKGFLRENREFAIIFVDDGSQDGTINILNGLKQDLFESVYIIRLSTNTGKAEAVRQGILRAASVGIDAIGYWDADLSTPLDQIHRMRLKMEGKIAIVLGARVKLLGHTIQRKANRHYLGRVYATLSSIVLDMPVYDTQCGAKLFKNDVLLKAVFSRPFNVDWSFDVEILARYQLIRRREGREPLNCAALEVPLKQWTHKPGSKVKPTDFFVALYELFLIFLLSRLPIIRKKYVNGFQLMGTVADAQGDE